MGDFDNLREFMDRLNFLALKNFYRTKAALDDIEAGTFSTAQSLQNPLAFVNDVIGLWLPGAHTFKMPRTLVIAGSKATGTAAGSIDLGLTSATSPRASALQPMGMPPGTRAIKGADVSATIVAPSLHVGINNLGSYAVGNYKGLMLDAAGDALAFVEFQLGP